MNIKTGCFFYNYEDALKISIARSEPKFFKGPKIEPFVPSYYLLHNYKLGRVTDEEYTARFIDENLRFLNQKSMLAYIKTLANDYNTDTYKPENIILCCWEKTGFCHRHIVADWLGIEEAKHQ